MEADVSGVVARNDPVALQALEPDSKAAPPRFFSLAFAPGRAFRLFLLLGVLTFALDLGLRIAKPLRAWRVWRDDTMDEDKRAAFHESLAELGWPAVAWFEFRLRFNAALLQRGGGCGNMVRSVFVEACAINETLRLMETNAVRGMIQRFLYDERTAYAQIGVLLLDGHPELIKEHRHHLMALATADRYSNQRPDFRALALMAIYDNQPTSEIEDLALEWLKSPIPSLREKGASFFHCGLPRARREDELIALLRCQSTCDFDSLSCAFSGPRGEENVRRVCRQRYEQAPDLARPVLLAEWLSRVSRDFEFHCTPELQAEARRLALMPPVRVGRLTQHPESDVPGMDGLVYVEPWIKTHMSPATREPPVVTSRDLFGTILGYSVAGFPGGELFGAEFSRHQNRLMTLLPRFSKFRPVSSVERASMELPDHWGLRLSPTSSVDPKKAFMPDIPILQSPASKADHANGRAIFHLGGEGRKAELKLPASCETGPKDKPVRWLILQAERDKDGKLWLGGVSRDDIRKLDADRVRLLAPADE